MTGDGGNDKICNQDFDIREHPEVEFPTFLSPVEDAIALQSMVVCSPWKATEEE